MNEEDGLLMGGNVALALVGLKGSVETGFATVNGQLNVALQRQDTADREIKDLKRKLAQLEAKMYKLSITAALLGGGGATGIYQFM